MAKNSNLIARYVWLVDILRRHGHLTFEEISNLWEDSPLGKGEPLPLRTFHNHRKAIEDIFDINIECDTKDGYQYYIESPEELQNGSFRSWLIESFTTMNQLKADSKLEKRVVFEHIPSGNTWLHPIVEAMKKNVSLKVTYQGFESDYPSTFEFEPYIVKVFRRRWYAIGRSSHHNHVLTLCLDRMHALEISDTPFTLPKDFDVDENFDGCCGMFTNKEKPKERIVVKIYAPACYYIHTLPIHSSQKVVSEDDESMTFEYKLRPNYEFLQELLMQADNVEVLEPQSVIDDLKRFAQNILNYYK